MVMHIASWGCRKEYLSSYFSDLKIVALTRKPFFSVNYSQQLKEPGEGFNVAYKTRFFTNNKIEYNKIESLFPWMVNIL